MPPPPEVAIDPELWRNTKYMAGRYREVHALLIGLENDSSHAIHELHDLDRVLREDYAMATRIITIPETGGEVLSQELNKFRRYYEAPDILLLVFFDGREKALPELKLWDSLYRLFECGSEFLVLIHEMTGERAPEVPHNPEGANVTEIIRTRPDQLSVCPEYRSFTFHVLAAFRKLRNKPFFTASSLGRWIHTCMRAHETRVRSSHPRLQGSPSRDLLFASLSPTRRPTKQEIHIIPFRVDDVRAWNGSGVLDEHKEAHRWGPLGALGPGWEKRIDNGDSHWRPYYYDGNTDTSYWTRPWSSVIDYTSN